MRHVLLVTMLLAAACGGSSSDPDAPPATPDTAVALDAAASDAPPGAPGDLDITWTVNGVDVDHATTCVEAGVGWFGVAVAPAIGPGSLGVDCVNGLWNSGTTFHDATPGTYTVTITAGTGVCCAGTPVDTGTFEIQVFPGASTRLDIDYEDGTFVPAP